MRFMMYHKPDASMEAGIPPSPELMTRMGVFMEEVTKAGVLLSGEGLHPSSKAVRIRLADGQFTVTDGPFAETKELIAGFAIVDVASTDDAVAWSKKFFEVLGSGEGYIQPIVEMSDFDPSVFSTDDATTK